MIVFAIWFTCSAGMYGWIKDPEPLWGLILMTMMWTFWTIMLWNKTKEWRKG